MQKCENILMAADPPGQGYKMAFLQRKRLKDLSNVPDDKSAAPHSTPCLTSFRCLNVQTFVHLKFN